MFTALLFKQHMSPSVQYSIEKEENLKHFMTWQDIFTLKTGLLIYPEIIKSSLTLKLIRSKNMSCVSEKPNPHRPRYQRKDACSHYKGTCLLKSRLSAFALFVRNWLSQWGVDLTEKLKDTPSASSADKLWLKSHYPVFLFPLFLLLTITITEN